MTKKELHDLVKFLRPTSKFVLVTDSSEFVIEDNQTPYFFVSLYDEEIAAEFVEAKEFTAIFHNTYLSSFAYNVHLSWLYCNKYLADDSQINEKLNILIHYNFKKFFAEQLFHVENNVYSRTVLLESLLFEQQTMLAVFKKENEDQEFKLAAKSSQELMSSLISLHEYGHLAFGNHPSLWTELMERETWLVEYDNFLSDQGLNEQFLEEIKCDAFAFINVIRENDIESNLGYKCNSIILGYSLYAVFYSISMTAKASINEPKAYLEKVDFSNLDSNYREFAFIKVIDTRFIKRAKYMLQAIKYFGEFESVQVLTEYKPFQLPENILDSLVSLIDSIINPDIITTSNQNALAHLCAEAFYDHPEGIEYLYKRSKIFKSGRNDLKM